MTELSITVLDDPTPAVVPTGGDPTVAVGTADVYIVVGGGIDLTADHGVLIFTTQEA